VKAVSDVEAYHALLSAIINRAIDDVQGIGPSCHGTDTDRAMAFINSEYCEGFCLELGIDYETVKKKGAVLYQCFLNKVNFRGCIVPV